MDQIELLSGIDCDPELYEELLCNEEMEDCCSGEVAPLASNGERLIFDPAKGKYSTSSFILL